MSVWAVEGAPRCGKTVLLAELAERGHSVLAEPDPVDESSDALLAHEINSLHRTVPAGTEFIERSAASIAFDCTVYASIYADYAESFVALAKSAKRVPVVAHFVLKSNEDYDNDLVAALEATSTPVVVVETRHRSVSEIVDTVLAAAHPQTRLFL